MTNDGYFLSNTATLSSEKSMSSIQLPRVSSNWRESRTKKSVMEQPQLSLWQENLWLLPDHSWKWDCTQPKLCLPITRPWISPKRWSTRSLSQLTQLRTNKLWRHCKAASAPSSPAGGASLSLTSPSKPPRQSLEQVLRTNSISRSKDMQEWRKFQEEPSRTAKCWMESWSTRTLPTLRWEDRSETQGLFSSTAPSSIRKVRVKPTWSSKPKMLCVMLWPKRWKKLHWCATTSSSGSPTSLSLRKVSLIWPNTSFSRAMSPASEESEKLTMSELPESLELRLLIDLKKSRNQMSEPNVDCSISEKLVMNTFHTLLNAKHQPLALLSSEELPRMFLMRWRETSTIVWVSQRTSTLIQDFYLVEELSRWKFPQESMKKPANMKESNSFHSEQVNFV